MTDNASGKAVAYGVGFIDANGDPILRRQLAPWTELHMHPTLTPEDVRPDCGTCANRGRLDGLSQETHCEHCCWQESWRTDRYAPKGEQA